MRIFDVRIWVWNFLSIIFVVAAGGVSYWLSNGSIGVAFACAAYLTFGIAAAFLFATVVLSCIKEAREAEIFLYGLMGLSIGYTGMLMLVGILVCACLGLEGASDTLGVVFFGCLFMVTGLRITGRYLPNQEDEDNPKYSWRAAFEGFPVLGALVFLALYILSRLGKATQSAYDGPPKTIAS